MNYYEMLQKQDPRRVALVHEGMAYTYGELLSLAEKRADCISDKGEGKRLYPVREPDVLSQLAGFLAGSCRGLVPMIVPESCNNVPEGEIPDNACMAVMTSGSTGTPKILYRSYESWADYFETQNEIFGIHPDTKLFAQGSLAFTGNLNLYMAQLSVGACIVAHNAFDPKGWVHQLEEQEVDAIYLIPSKLLCLPRVMKAPNERVKTILSGSQSMGKKEADWLKDFFPNARIVLYYGASELNYITYVTDENMTEENNLIGKPFPGVRVFVEKNEIFVDTPYHVEGIQCPFSLADTGYLDEAGNLYFSGRSDDIVGIRGHKVSLFRIENALIGLEGIREAVVLPEKSQNTPTVRAEKVRLTAYVTEEEALATGREKEKKERWLKHLREELEPYEMPTRIEILPELPHNESGKIDRAKLAVIGRDE